MNALVSGQASVAILENQKGLFYLRLDSDSPVRCSEGDRSYLLADAADVQEFPNVTVEKAIEKLELAWSKDRVLHLTLILLDKDTSEGLRVDAADCLQEMIEEDERALDFVSSRLYSAALPEEADGVGAIQSAEHAKATLVVEFLEGLLSNQDGIRRWRAVWDALPDSLFEDLDHRLRTTSAVIASGAFLRFVQAKDRKSLDAARMRCLAQPPLDAVPGSVQMLSAWTESFLPAIPKRDSVKLEPEGRLASGPVQRKRAGRRKGAEEKLDAVDRQKAEIRRLLSKGRVAQAKKYIEQLVEHHRSQSRPKHTVKSLCDLGMEAKELGLHDLQLDLAGRAVSILPDDGWALCQLGDAYRHFGKHKQAISAYDMAERCGEPEVARTGKAEVLKAQGRFEQALAAYEATIKDFPGNVFARNGKAEVLKAQGRFEQALAAYEATIKDFPGNVFARTGKAEVLKAQGRFEQALAAYEATIKDFPGNVFARTGKAEVLKAQGRFEQALAAYEAIIKDFPGNVVARTGKAEVLKAQGRFEQALAAYEAIIKDFPGSVVARSGKAEVLKAQGQFEEALEAYEAIIKDFPGSVVARSGKAEVLKAQGQFEEALEAYEATIKDFPGNVVARNGKAEVLKAQGQFEEALEAYEATIKDFPGSVVARSGKAQVLKAQGQFEQALKAYEATIKDFPGNVVARSGKAEVLKAQGQFEEALEAYEATIKDFPGNVVARSGKAEVLKAQGQFEEALAAYEAIIKDFPGDVVARNGKASLLLSQGRYKEALPLAKGEPQRTEDEWTNLHIRGMIFLRSGHIEKAADVFESGSQKNPWAASRAYFKSALAMVRMGQDKAVEAAELIADDRSPIGFLVRAHALAEMGRVDDARDTLRNVEGTPIAKVAEVCKALDQRYFSQEPSPGEEFDEWICRLEHELFIEGYTNREYREPLALAPN